MPDHIRCTGQRWYLATIVASYCAILVSGDAVTAAAAIVPARHLLVKVFALVNHLLATDPDPGRTSGPLHEEGDGLVGDDDPTEPSCAGAVHRKRQDARSDAEEIGRAHV